LSNSSTSKTIENVSKESVTLKFTTEDTNQKQELKQVCFVVFHALSLFKSSFLLILTVEWTLSNRNKKSKHKHALLHPRRM
jgi:hypothetical protein